MISFLYLLSSQTCAFLPLYHSVRTKCKEWFGYTTPTFQPLYTYIPLVSPLKKNDKMDGFNMGEDNQIKSIDIKNGKLRFEVRGSGELSRLKRASFGVFALILFCLSFGH